MIPYRTFGRWPPLWSLVVGAVFLISAVSANAQQLQFTQGVVAADHPAASEAGVEILRQGGNVVDAAVATSFALSVVRPESCGIGGGGFMVIWNAQTGTSVAIDYRERAPSGASQDMFADDHSSSDTAAADGSEPQSVRGGLAVGVPGTVAGLCFAAEKYGTLSLSQLLAPAIRLARDGVLLDDFDRSIHRTTVSSFRRRAAYPKRFASLWTGYLNEGEPLPDGQRFHSPQLPALERIASSGARGFYEGDVAAKIVDTVQSAGGILTAEDLLRYQPTIREPLRGEFHGRQLFTMPPPSSGGIALLQTLQTLQAWETQHKTTLQQLEFGSTSYLHTVTEAMKHAFADRAEFLGDTDFVEVPVQRLLSAEYAQRTAARIHADYTLSDERYGRFFAADDGGTSHFSVMDQHGNAVACTETINLTFGSYVMVPDYGIILNNQIDDFAARPGEVNAFGLKQSEANAIAPGKRPLSSMTPTIVVNDGRAVYSTGASGGPRIISATIQSTLNHLVFGMAPQDAVAAPRLHHQWFPANLLLEKSLYQSQRIHLERLGHRVVEASNLAACQAVSATRPDHKVILFGGSDARKHGQPAGF